MPCMIHRVTDSRETHTVNIDTDRTLSFKHRSLQSEPIELDSTTECNEGRTELMGRKRKLNRGERERRERSGGEGHPTHLSFSHSVFLFSLPFNLLKKNEERTRIESRGESERQRKRRQIQERSIRTASFPASSTKVSDTLSSMQRNKEGKKRQRKRTEARNRSTHKNFFLIPVLLLLLAFSWQEDMTFSGIHCFLSFSTRLQYNKENKRKAREEHTTGEIRRVTKQSEEGIFFVSLFVSLNLNGYFWWWCPTRNKRQQKSTSREEKRDVTFMTWRFLCERANSLFLLHDFFVPLLPILCCYTKSYPIKRQGFCLLLSID